MRIELYYSLLFFFKKNSISIFNDYPLPIKKEKKIEDLRGINYENRIVLFSPFLFFKKNSISIFNDYPLRQERKKNRV